MRPINKKFFGPGPDKIAIRFHNGTAVVDGYIVKQLGSTSYRVSDGSIEKDCKLVQTMDEAANLTGSQCAIVIDTANGEQVVKKLMAFKASVTGPTKEVRWQGPSGASKGSIRRNEDVATGDDTTPNAFSFAPVDSAVRASVVESQSTTITGLGADAPISITGGEYRIGAGSWVSTSGIISNGQSVRVRITSSSSFEAMATATLTIGSRSAAFSVTTEVGTLNALTLASMFVSEDTGAGQVISPIQSRTIGSTITLIEDANGRFAISGNNLVTGSTSFNFESAANHTITFRETLAGASNSPRDTTVVIEVGNVFEQPNLAALALSASSISEASATGTVVGAIQNKSTGSTLTLSNSAGNRFAISGTNLVRGAAALDFGTATQHSITIRETLGDAANSPRDTVITIDVVAAEEADVIPATQTIAFGSLTRAGHGGHKLAYTGNGYLSVSGSPNFEIDDTNSLVPSGSFGAAPPATFSSAAPYTLTVTEYSDSGKTIPTGKVSTVTVTVSALLGYMVTWKDSGANADSITSYQMRTVASIITSLGGRITIRDGAVLNPAGGDMRFRRTGSTYTGTFDETNHVVIASETPLGATIRRIVVDGQNQRRVDYTKFDGIRFELTASQFSAGNLSDIISMLGSLGGADHLAVTNSYFTSTPPFGEGATPNSQYGYDQASAVNNGSGNTNGLGWVVEGNTFENVAKGVYLGDLANKIDAAFATVTTTQSDHNASTGKAHRVVGNTFIRVGGDEINCANACGSIITDNVLYDKATKVTPWDLLTTAQRTSLNSPYETAIQPHGDGIQLDYSTCKFGSVDGPIIERNSFARGVGRDNMPFFTAPPYPNPDSKGFTPNPDSPYPDSQGIFLTNNDPSKTARGGTGANNNLSGYPTILNGPVIRNNFYLRSMARGINVSYALDPIVERNTILAQTGALVPNWASAGGIYVQFIYGNAGRVTNNLTTLAPVIESQPGASLTIANNVRSNPALASGAGSYADTFQAPTSGAAARTLQQVRAAYAPSSNGIAALSGGEYAGRFLPNGNENETRNTSTPMVANNYTFEGITWRAWDAPTGGNPKTVNWYIDEAGWPTIVADSNTWFDTDLPSVDGGHGMHKNPFFSSASSQGFDSILSQAGSGQGAAIFPYDSSLNIDPGNTGVRVHANEASSYVKARRVAGLTGPSQWSVIERFSVLTVLAEPPLEGFFAPAVSSTDKTPPMYRNEINWDAFGEPFALATGMPSLATADGQDYMKSSVQPYWGNAPGESARRMRILNTTLTDNGYSGGSSGFGVYWSEWFHAMLSLGKSGIQANPSPLFKAIRVGLELCANAARGLDYNGGAGQSQGRKQFAQLMGHINHKFMTDALTIRGGTTIQPYWEFAENVGTPRNGWDGRSSNHDVLRGTATEEQVGRPNWYQEPVSGVYPHTSNPTMDSNINGDYHITAGYSGMLEMLNILLLKNGPNGWDGSQVIARSANNFGPSNPWAAATAHWDLYRTLNNSQSSGTRPYSLTVYKQAHARAYDQRRGDAVAPKWAGVPYAFAADNKVEQFLFPITGGFGWRTDDPSNMVWDTLNITQMDIKYSLDGRQFIEEVNVGRTGSKTTDVPSGVRVFVKLIAHNEYGRGLEPVNYPRAVGDQPRMTVTTTGSGVGQPTNQVSPQIMRKRYTTVGEDLFIPANEGPVVGRTYYAGSGWWPNGDLIANPINFRWTRDGVEFSTADTYVAAIGDGSKDIRLFARAGTGPWVEASNFLDGVADTTAPVLSNPTDERNGTTAARLVVDTNEGEGNLFWYISTSNTPPSLTNLLSGAGAVVAGSQPVTASGTQTVNTTGLQGNTTYYGHFAHRDSSGNVSAIVSGDGFATASAGVRSYYDFTYPANTWLHDIPGWTLRSPDMRFDIANAGVSVKRRATTGNIHYVSEGPFVQAAQRSQMMFFITGLAGAQIVLFGTWVDGKFNGYTLYPSNNTTLAVGRHNNGVRTGIGTLTVANSLLSYQFEAIDVGTETQLRVYDAAGTLLQTFSDSAAGRLTEGYTGVYGEGTSGSTIVTFDDFYGNLQFPEAVADMAFTRQSSASWLGQTVEFRDNEVYGAGAPAQALVAHTPDGQILIKPEAGIWAFCSTPSDTVPLNISGTTTFCKQMAGADTVGPVSGVMVRRNGVMKNPMLYNEAAGQGFDERLSYGGGTGMGGPKQPAASRYNPAVNRHHSVTGVGIPLTESGSYIQSIAGSAWDAPMTTNLPWDLVVLWWGFHILDAGHNPKVGSFAPSIFSTSKVCEYRIGETDKNILSGVPLQAGLDDIATLEAATPQANKFMPDGILPFFNTSGERRRRLGLSTGLTNYAGNSGYGIRFARWMAALDAAGSSVSDAVWAKAVAHGLHIVHQYNVDGPINGGGAGQSCGHWGFAPFTRFAFRGRTDLEAKCRAVLGNEVDQPIRVLSHLVGNIPVPVGRYVDSTAGRTNHGNIHIPYYPAQEGIMDWNTAGGGGAFNADINADIASDYRSTASYPVLSTLANAANLRNGPGGITGAQWMLNGGAFDTSNTAKTAWALGYLERAGRWQYNSQLSDLMVPAMQQRFLETRSAWGVAPYAYRPDAAAPYPGNQSVYLTFTNGGFTLNTTTLVTSALPILEYECRYSQDGNSWKSVANVSGQFTVTGLPLGCYLYVSYRGRNSAGWGAWSTNLPSHYENGVTNLTVKRMVGRTLGTSTGTTVFDNTLTAKVGVPAFPLWGPFDIRPVSENPVNLSIHDTIYPLLGWVDGTVPDGSTVEWRRGATLLSTGAAPYYGYSIKATDLGTNDIFVRVIRNGVASDSAPVSIPARAAQASTVVFELNTNVEFYYPNVMTSLRANSLNLSGVDTTRYSTQSLDEAGEIVYGAPTFSIRGLKSNTGAILTGNMAADYPLVAGRTYRVEGVMPIGFGRTGQQAGRTVSFQAGPILASTSWANLTYVAQAAPNDKYEMPINFTFTPTAGQTDLFFRVNANSNNGAANGGDPMLSKIKITDVTP